MSILIKGIEMPTAQQGYMTVRIYYEGTCVRPNWQGDCTVIKGAEAVKIPTPHGRLIDADALDKRIEEGGCCCTEEYAEWMGKCIDNAPTIIEAEEET